MGRRYDPNANDYAMVSIHKIMHMRLDIDRRDDVRPYLHITASISDPVIPFSSRMSTTFFLT